MPGGAIKKISKVKGSEKKVPAKASVKPPVVLPNLKVEAKKTVPRKSKKVSLSVRAINTRPAKVVEREINKEENVIKKNIRKTKVVSVDESQGLTADASVTPEKARLRSKELRRGEGKILTLKTEKEKRIVMWAGVSFFMALIVIYWAYTTVYSIRQSRNEWKQSPKAANWNQLTDELSGQIEEMKSGIEAVKQFSSTSKEIFIEPETNAPIFSGSISTSSGTVDQEMLENLKHELELKSGASEPLFGDYFFIMTMESQTEFFQKLETIKIGDGINKVRETLSEPDFSEELLDKRGNFVSNILTYNIRIFDKEKANGKYDKYVSLEFDQNGILEKINKVID